MYGGDLFGEISCLRRTPRSATVVAAQDCLVVVLLRNITSSGLTISYYDGSGNAYSTYTNYLTGIKQLMLQFSTQAGVSGNGSQTRIYQIASSRLVLRNRAYLQ